MNYILIRKDLNTYSDVEQLQLLSSYCFTNDVLMDTTNIISYSKDDNLSILLDSLKDIDRIYMYLSLCLGDTFDEIIHLLDILLSKGISIFIVKSNINISKEDGYKGLTYSFDIFNKLMKSYSSEITSEVLKNKKREGKVLGRPLGSYKANPKLLESRTKIRQKLNEGVSINQLAKTYDVAYKTMYDFVHKCIPSYKSSRNIR